MKPRQVAQRYELESEIATGGMGTVWRATDVLLRRRVAVKLLRSDGESGDPHLFEREAKVVAQLHHRNVVQIFDFGFDAATPYLVMELLEGQDLAQRIIERGRLTLGEVSAMVSAGARGLAAAHAAGFVHRDLKPANLFYDRRHGEETLKVLDFGVAAAMRRSLGAALGTAERIIAGTPEFMSPEQVRGALVDPRTDVWALAVCAWNALTGTMPFTGADVSEALDAVMHLATPSVRRIVPELPEELDAFFEQALAKRPGDRFNNPLKMAAVLRQISEESEQLRARLLIVDDEPDVETLMRQSLRREVRSGKYTLDFAADGVEALEVLERHADIDVVLSDINMPRMDGLTLLEHVNEVNPNARVVMVSAYGDMGNIRKAMNRGAFDFVTKPFDVTDLKTTIEKTARHVRVVRSSFRSVRELAHLRWLVATGVADRLATPGDDSMVAAPETRIATVLVLRFTPIGEGAEGDAFRGVAGAWPGAIAEVTGRDGTVLQFTGDELVVVFDGPGDTARAAAAGDAIAQSVRDSDVATRTVEIRMGLARGEVAWGHLGNARVGCVRAVGLGKPVVQARELVDLARPGELLITDELVPELDEHYTLRQAKRQRGRWTIESSRLFVNETLAEGDTVVARGEALDESADDG